MNILDKIRRRRDTVTVILATVNIGRGVTTATAVAMLRLVFRTLVRVSYLGTIRRGIMLGLQEIDEADAPDEHGLLHDVARALGGKRLTFVGFATAVPFTVPPGWRIVWTLVAPVSGGRGKPKPPPHYPTRFAVVAMLEHERTGIRVIRANGHWTRDEFPAVWTEGNASWRALIGGRDGAPVEGSLGHGLKWTGPRPDLDRLDAHGLLGFGVPILFTADRNKRHAGRLAPGGTFERSLLPDGSIDELRVIVPQGCDFDVQIGARKVYADVKIDGHDLEGRILTLRKRVAA